MGEFLKDPVSCLTLASYLITNTGARRACVCGTRVWQAPTALLM